ncbi:MAG: helix-turn-helix domain-containing protein [Ktedonobacteraceae bacterium]|nr:helix-turn-helix domain-containing protein [Ktedonobacteraceae bacterium]
MMNQAHYTKLRQERELRGWSRAYIAEQVGVDTTTVGRWERGEQLPHPHYRQKLCVLFEKSAQELGLLSEGVEEQDDRIAISNPPPTSSSTYENEIRGPLVDERVSRPTEIPLATFATLSEVSKLPISKVVLLTNTQNRQRMLKKMYTFWINGLLEQSLHGANFVPLDLEGQRDAVIDPWTLTLQQPEVVPRPLSTNMHISQVYDEADGELLILGEPGSGKTTLLLELTRTLLSRATEEVTHPIPVVFNLASWAIKRQSLGDWFVEELHTKYQVPRKLAQAWAQAEQILPLLDGLDEVIASARSACIETINAYRQEHGLLPMVICSRQDDYFVQSARLLLRRAVIVQPLKPQQIEAYLTGAGEQLAALRDTLQKDSTLRDLARSPLMLSILAQTNKDRAVNGPFRPLSLEARRHEVFATYVERMLTHRKSQNHYPAKQTLHWLSWLARQLMQQQQTQFYIERMQPDWLPHPQAFRWYCRLLVGLLSGLFGGIIGMLADVSLYEVVHKQLYVLLTHSTISASECADTLPPLGTVAAVIDSVFSLPTVGLLYGIGFGLLGGLIGGLTSRRNAQQVHTMRARLYQRGFALLLGLGCGSIFVLINLLWVPCPVPGNFYNQAAEELSYGLAGVLAGGLVGGLAGDLFGARKTLIQPVEALVRIRISGRRRLISSLLGAASGILVGGGTDLVHEVYLKFFLWQDHLLISALLGGLLGLVIGGWLGGFSHHMLEEPRHIKPNEGIRRSARNGLLIGLPLGLALSSFAFGLALWIIPSHLTDGLLWCIPFGLIVTALLVLLNGGYACLQHMVLRFVLSYLGYIPWNYARFLDEAAEKLLLRKVGGGYIFIHRLLLEYFASYWIGTQKKYHRFGKLKRHSL